MKINIEVSKTMGFADFLNSMRSSRCKKAYENDPIMSKKTEIMDSAYETLQPLFSADANAQTGERFTSLALKVATGQLDPNNTIEDFCNQMNELLAPDSMTPEQRESMMTLYGVYSDFFDAHEDGLRMKMENSITNENEEKIEETLQDAADFIGYDIPEDYETGAVIFPMPAGFPPHGRSVENNEGSRTQLVAIPIDSRNEPEQTLITIVHEDVHKLFYDSGRCDALENELGKDDFNLLNEGIAVAFQDDFCDKAGIKSRPYGVDSIDAEAQRLEKYIQKGEKLFGDDGKLSPGIKTPEKNVNPILSQKLQEGLTQ
ncbi:MAG: hypothetical protein II942_02115 [Alphaproteobacteria bacterium]|nr:hypothetical protein [Alphaproteobacteria bacterium]